MKKVLLVILRGIVGPEFGWSGEGNEQWYYFLALVMDCMLTWWLKPELGVLFTIMAVIHFITVFIYGYHMLDMSSVWFSIAYFSTHGIMFIIGLINSWTWTLIMSAIVIISFLLAPDCMGENFVMHLPEGGESNGYYIYTGKVNVVAILMFHTFWFTVFSVIALSLPVALWIRLGIIVACMALHPLMDWLEGECVNISDVTNDALERLREEI